jgi:hypothetical protein
MIGMRTTGATRNLWSKGAFEDIILGLDVTAFCCNINSIALSTG